MTCADLVNAQIAIIETFEQTDTGPAWMLTKEADAASLAVTITKTLIDNGYQIVASATK